MATISKIQLNGTTYDIVDTDTTTSGVAVCSTAADTAAKTVTFPDFKLVSGQYILLRVSNTNTATRSSVTLNVNSTGAKSVKVGGSTSTQLSAGDYLATYDGTSWNLTRVYLDADTNQKVKTGSVTFGANDTVEFVAGANVSISGDATNKKITIKNTIV